MFHSPTPSNFSKSCLGAQLEMRGQRTEVSKINQQKRLTPIGPQTEAAAMSYLELAAILRAKAWRNYPGVFTAPELRQERTARAVQAGHRTDSFGQLNGVPIGFAAIVSRIIRQVPEASETNATRMASG